MKAAWAEAWHDSIGERVSVVLDDQQVVEGTVTKLWPNVPYMEISGDDGRNHFSHPSYVRPVWQSKG